MITTRVTAKRAVVMEVAEVHEATQDDVQEDSEDVQDVHQPRVLETREVITVTTITIETKMVNATDVTTEGIVVIAEIEATGATEEIGVTGEIAVIAKVVIAMVADHAEGDMVATERQRAKRVTLAVPTTREFDKSPTKWTKSRSRLEHAITKRRQSHTTTFLYLLPRNFRAFVPRWCWFGSNFLVLGIHFEKLPPTVGSIVVIEEQLDVVLAERDKVPRFMGS